MVDCELCKNYGNDSKCTQCPHGEFFERAVISEPKKISINYGAEYCGHCGYNAHYAEGYKRFYCIRCGGYNLRTWE